MREPIGDGPTAPEAMASTATTAVTTRTYDAAGNLLVETDPKGNPTTYQYHPDGLLKSKEGPLPGVRWTYTYDAFGRPVEKALQAPASADAGWKGGTWTYQYGLSSGATAQETDPLGYKTERWYNARKLLLKQVRHDEGTGRTSQNLHRTELTYDGPWVGKQVVTEGSATTTLERTRYDHRGRVQREKESFSGPDSAAAYSYVAEATWTGREAALNQQWTPAGLSAGSRSGSRTVDALEQVISQVWGAFTDAWTYDAAGRLRSEQAAGKPEKTYDWTEGLLTSVTYGGAETTSFGYWGSGKLEHELGPDLRRRSLWWNERGLLAKEEYGRGGNVATTRHEYDAAGNPRATTHGVGADAAEWAYASGPRGELVSVTQPGDLGKFAYGYDAMGALATITPPKDGVVGPSAIQTFEYDYLGRQVKRTRGDATWTTAWENGAATIAEPNETNPELAGARSQYRSLDGRGRLAVVEYRGVPSDLTRVETRYDALDNPLKVTETRGSGNADVVFTYGDERRLLTRIDRSEPLGSISLGYGRTASGELQSVTSPSGTIEYDYDGLDRLKTITAGGRATTLTWEDGGGRLLEASDLTRLRECRRYDDRGRLALVSNVPPGTPCDPAAAPIAEFQYGYDDRGNRISQVYRNETLSVPELTYYGYDKADRLTGTNVAGVSATLYRLGADGSRLEDKSFVGAFSGSLDPSGWSTPGGAKQVYGHDARGGLTSILDEAGNELVRFTVDVAGRVRAEVRGANRKTYSWDADGRLVHAEVTKPVVGGGSATEGFDFRYDFGGRRILKRGTAGDTRYVWGADGLAEEWTPTGKRLLYERGDGMVTGVSSYDSAGTSLGSERFLHDGLGSVVGRVGSASGVAMAKYDAWGVIRSGAPGAADPSLAYAGQHWDRDLGLSYAQQRWYQPETGRFLSEDPVFGKPANPSSLMVFGYAGGNPVLYWDPSGERPLAPEVQQAWDAAKKANFDAASVKRLLEAQADDRARLGIGDATTEAMLDFATVRMTVAKLRWGNGDYGTAILHGALGVSDSFGAGSVTGDTNADTARNVGKAVVAGAVIKRVLGLARRLGYGRGSAPSPAPDAAAPAGTEPAQGQATPNAGTAAAGPVGSPNGAGAPSPSASPSGVAVDAAPATPPASASPQAPPAAPDVKYVTVRPGFKPTPGRGGAPGSRPGEDFTPAGRDEVLQRNASSQPDGIARCKNPNCNAPLTEAQQSRRGVSPRPDEAAVDHRKAKADQGSGDPSNGDALCRTCNRIKSDGPVPWTIPPPASQPPSGAGGEGANPGAGPE